MDRYLTSVGESQTLNPSRQKLSVKRMKTKKGENRPSSKRKSLQILQPSAQHQSLLVGVNGVLMQNNKPKKTSGKRKGLGDDHEDRPRKLSRSSEEFVDNETNCKESKPKPNIIIKASKRSEGQQKAFAVFEDPSSASSDDSDQERTKTAEEEAYELMVQEHVPESYWKDLAETRREALEDALRENEELHDEVANLKSKNERLQIMADQAEYLATVVEELMGEDGEDSKKEDTRQNGETSSSASELEDKSKPTTADVTEPTESHLRTKMVTKSQHNQHL